MKIGIKRRDPGQGTENIFNKTTQDNFFNA